MEALVQYLWQHRLWPPGQLRLTDGRPVTVIDPGRLNTGSGPDFFNAKIRLGDRIWAGDVEIHLRASDWNRHGHAVDPAYDSVILHVVTRDDCPIRRRTTGEIIPQLVVTCSPEFRRRCDDLLSRAPMEMPCADEIARSTPLHIADWMTSLALERLYMKADRIYDPESLYDAGIMMGFHQNADGALSWGYGQHYAKYDLLGRKVFNRRLPANYADFSHAMMPAENGGYFLRVASPDLRRADDTRVRTVRDVIIEVDASGEVVDEWRLFEILDPNRNIVLKSIDQGAVCLNIDTSQSGKTLSAEQLAKLEAQHAFGDIAGTGAGRNWAHVNSVDHDPVDDSIILSSRHQSAVVKIGRDKQVKWILAAPNGWRDGLKDKVLTPVGKDGRPLSCRIGKCEGGFDWTWTQHTAWKIDELSKGDIVYVSVFDNGDGRAFVQPEDQNEKYSRAVVYKIDQKAMTVEQVWEYGKERGHELYSPITSSVEYQADKNSVVVYWASIGTGSKTGPAPVLTEFRWGETKPAFEMHLKGGMGYRALPIDAQKAFVR